MYTKRNVLLGNLGLDTSSPAEYIDDRATPKGQNMYVNRNAMHKRFGTAALGSSLGEEVMAVKELLVDQTRSVIRIGLTKVELLNQVAGTWSNVTGSALTGTTADPFSVATPTLSTVRTLVFSNFIDNIRKFDGVNNTADLGGTPPKAKFLQEYGPYLVLAHVDDGNKRRMRVQWSDTGDIEEWSSGNAGSVDLLEDGNDITGLSIFGNYICVHKESSIYLGYLVPTDEIFKFDRKSTSVGTVCNNTIQNVGENVQLFLARDGIRMFNGISAPLINAPISDELRESMNAAYLHKCWSVVVPELNEYWVGVPIGSRTNPDTIYKYNYVTGQCYKDFIENVTACGVYQQTTQYTWENMTSSWDSSTIRWDDIYLTSLFPSVIFGTVSGTTANRSGSTNNDSGVAIDAYRETKDFEGDEKGGMARWLELQVWAKGNSITIDYSTDSGTTWNSVGTYTLSSDYPSDDDPLFAYFDVVSSKIRFRFRNNTLNETFSLKDFVIGYSVREARR